MCTHWIFNKKRMLLDVVAVPNVKYYTHTHRSRKKNRMFNEEKNGNNW